MTRLHVCLSSVIVASLTFSGVAHAGSSDTDSVACGSTAASWNAPNGALVVNRSTGGIVDPVLTAVGEYYTHSMISHGPGGHVSHSTMFTPGTTGWPQYCSTPIRPDELRSGYPGPAQVNQGGIYTALYHGSQVDRIIYQRSSTAAGFDTRGEGIANHLWFTQPYTTVASRQNGGQYLYRLRHHETQNFMNYVLYQFRWVERLNEGVPAWNNGTVCSTFLAYAHHVAGQGTVSAHQYSHAQIVAAGNAIYATIEDKCNTDTDWLTDVGSAITCFEGICDDAARQTRNCMAAGVCDSDDSNYWNSVANDPNSVAISISADRLGGWSGHPWTGPGVSVWAYDVGADVQWNSGGNVYGCWF